MHLQQWAFARPPGRVHKDEEICHWSGHRMLHSFMATLALQRNLIEATKDFNDVELQLTLKDLEKLKGYVFRTYGLKGPLGANDYLYCRYEETDIVFIEKSKNWIKKGYIVIYNSLKK
jgi:hypothetical protein